MFLAALCVGLNINRLSFRLSLMLPHICSTHRSHRDCIFSESEVPVAVLICTESVNTLGITWLGHCTANQVSASSVCACYATHEQDLTVAAET